VVGAPSHSAAQETDLTIRSLDPGGPNPDRDFAVYIYDSTDDATVNYDRVLGITRERRRGVSCYLAAGAWPASRLNCSVNTRIGRRDSG
jgi:hypothetical protein